MKKKHNHYPDKRKEIMISTKFKVELIYGDILGNDSISTEQITKLKSLF